MILITVGCSNFKFDRLFAIVDELCDENIIDKTAVVAQTGNLDYKIRNFESFQYAPNDKMSEYIDQAELIITHAGTGTVVKSLERGKKLIIFPRLLKYNEHVSNHQIDLYNTFTQAGYAMGAMDKEGLIECLNKAASFEPKKFVSNRENFVEVIKGLIEN